MKQKDITHYDDLSIAGFYIKEVSDGISN
jgi:hypothetical protein